MLQFAVSPVAKNIAYAYSHRPLEGASPKAANAWAASYGPGSAKCGVAPYLVFGLSFSNWPCSYHILPQLNPGHCRQLPGTLHSPSTVWSTVDSIDTVLRVASGRCWSGLSTQYIEYSTVRVHRLKRTRPQRRRRLHAGPALAWRVRQLKAAPTSPDCVGMRRDAAKQQRDWAEGWVTPPAWMCGRCYHQARLNRCP